MKFSKPIPCEQCDNTECDIKRFVYPEWWPFISHFKQVYHLPKGQSIIQEGEAVEGIYFIYEGKVKVHKKWEENKDYIVRLAKTGDILGHRGFGEDLYYPISATALEASRICFIDLALFDRLLKTNTRFTYQILMFYASELKRAERRMRNLAHMDVKGRIADALLMIKAVYGFAASNDSVLNLKMTRKDLAALAGTTYETVIRSLNKLSDQKLVEVNGKAIKLLDENGLRELSRLEN